MVYAKARAIVGNDTHIVPSVHKSHMLNRKTDRILSRKIAEKDVVCFAQETQLYKTSC